jgi:hypothetical protein
MPDKVAVEDLGPDMPPGVGVDQLRGDTHTLGRRADTAFDDVADAQFARDDPEIARHVAVDEGRVARHDEEVAEPGQFGRDILDEAVGKPRQRGIAAEICEGQDDDRGTVWKGQRQRTRR